MMGKGRAERTDLQRNPVYLGIGFPAGAGQMEGGFSFSRNIRRIPTSMPNEHEVGKH
jgi:hypothetical protein